MLHYTGIFFIAVMAAIFGLGGMALGVTEIATTLFFIFLILFFGSLMWGVMSVRGTGTGADEERPRESPPSKKQAVDGGS